MSKSGAGKCQVTTTKALALQVISAGTGLLIFTLILLNRSPNPLRPISASLNTGFTIVIPASALILYLAFRLRGWVGSLTSFTITMALFGFALAGLWITGQSQTTILSGLIPIQDALGYYTDALRLLSGMEMSSFSGMRPFFPGLLSVLLLFSGRNLLIALGFLTAIGAICTYLAARQILRSHGAEAAVLFLILLFLYFRFQSGKTMSESLGVAFGALGVALFWQAVSSMKLWIGLLGLGLITLALNTRPGAMFVLPALLLWGAWFFRGRDRLSMKFLIFGAGVILTVFFMNSLMVKLLSGPQSAAFSNFSWAVYGVASGGHNWAYVFTAHPEVQQLSEPEQSRVIYRLAFDLIRQQPWLFIKGALHNWGLFFSNTWYGVFSFVGGETPLVNQISRWSLYLLSLAGLAKWLLDRNDGYASLAGMSALGVLASVPFVPPGDAYRVRLYAATIPLICLLPVMGLTFLLEKLKNRLARSSLFLGINRSDAARNQAYAGATWNMPIIISAALALTTLLVPPVIKSMGQKPAPIQRTCLPEMESVSIQFDQGTYINIIPENIALLDWMPNYHQGLFRRNMHGNTDNDLIALLGSIDASSTLFYSLDLQTEHEVFVIAPTEILPRPGVFIKLCGAREEDPDITSYRIFYPEVVIPAE